MTTLRSLRLKKSEDRRLRAGHVWIYSNEIDIQATPLKLFSKGEEVLVEAADKTVLGVAYVNPNSLITARLFTRRAHERLNTPFFVKQLKTALEWRERLFDTPYYRLVFGESDGLPGCVIDRFDDVLVIQLNTAGMDVQREMIVAACQTAFPWVQHILFRNDSGRRMTEGLEQEVTVGLGAPPQMIMLEENNTFFSVPLWEGQKTGWFYDHRLNRSRLSHYVADRSVLDVFSYLGAWGIQAAKEGASSVTCIDSSARATQLIQANAECNCVSDKVTVITEDAFVALKKLSQSDALFDVIVLDPPAFIKKLKDKKEGFLAYQRINEAALKLLAPGGLLISCSCSMHMGYDDLIQAIRRANTSLAHALQIVERGHQAPDHPIHLMIPETDYLKMVMVRRMG